MKTILLTTCILVHAVFCPAQYFYRLLGHRSTGSGTVFAAWDPTNVGSAIALSGTPFLTETSSGTGEVRATIPISIGSKRYWEVTVGGTSTTNMVIGVDNGSGVLTNYTGGSSGTLGLYGGGGYFYNGASNSSGQVSYNPGDVIGIALDLSAWTIQFYRNGTLDGSAISIASGTSYYPACGSGGGTMLTTANFGAGVFVYSVPTGFTGGIY